VFLNVVVEPHRVARVAAVAMSWFQGIFQNCSSSGVDADDYTESSLASSPASTPCASPARARSAGGANREGGLLPHHHQRLGASSPNGGGSPPVRVGGSRGVGETRDVDARARTAHAAEISKLRRALEAKTLELFRVQDELEEKDARLRRAELALDARGLERGGRNAGGFHGDLLDADGGGAEMDVALLVERLAESDARRDAAIEEVAEGERAMEALSREFARALEQTRATQLKLMRELSAHKTRMEADAREVEAEATTAYWALRGVTDDARQREAQAARLDEDTNVGDVVVAEAEAEAEASRERASPSSPTSAPSVAAASPAALAVPVPSTSPRVESALLRRVLYAGSHTTALAW
jgi:hypothetical protein